MKKFWTLKELKAKPQVQFYILKRCWPTKRTGICYLCLNEKLFIIEHQGNNSLNQRNELISKCRHKNKFNLRDHITWPLCGKWSCSKYFSGANFFPRLHWIMETCRVKPRIYSECDLMRVRPTLNGNTLHAVDVRTLLRYFDTIALQIYSYKLAAWLWWHETDSSNSHCFLS